MGWAGAARRVAEDVLVLRLKLMTMQVALDEHAIDSARFHPLAR